MTRVTEAVRWRADTPAACGVAFVVLLLATDLVFRRRDATLAVEGAVDTAIVVELTIWALVAVWAALLLFPAGRVRWQIFLETGPVLRALFVVTGLFLVTSVYAGGALEIVRGAQYALMVLVGLITYRKTAGDPEAIQQFWNAARRALWITISVAVVASVALGQVFPDLARAEIVPGEGPRFRIFRTHPITSAGLIGLAMIGLAGGWLGSSDSWFSRPRFRVLAAGLFTVFAVLLLATKARGALFATLAALLLLIALTWNRRRRGIAVLVGTASAGLFLLGMGNQFVREVVVRGQTTDQLLSLTGRTRLFEVAYELFLERPILGHGYHAARSIFLDQVRWAGHSHNAWVEVAVNTGIVGLAIMVYLFLHLGVRLRRARRFHEGHSRAWAGEGAALVVFVLLLGVVSPGFAGAPGYELAALVWAVVLADLSFSHRAPPVEAHTHRVRLRG